MWDSMSTDSCDACNCTSRIKTAFPLDDGVDVFMDKENLPIGHGHGHSPMKSDDNMSMSMSIYGSASPLHHGHCAETSPDRYKHLIRRPLEDFDPNSQDSGYAASYDAFGKFSSYSSPVRGQALSFSSGSMCSMDEEFFEELADVEPPDENLPQDLAKLISGPRTQLRHALQSPSAAYESPVRPPVFRRSMSLQIEGDTPNRNRARCLFADVRIKFKRPEPPSEEDSPTTKKYKRLPDLDLPLPVLPVLQRSVSATEESIKYALQRSSTEPDLIGDFSKTFCLPLVTGRHQDLKSINAGTLVQLIQGDFRPYVDSFTVIDCRYPYEFDGGHIGGAVNIYTRDQCMDLLNSQSVPTTTSNGRHILVFHCEFSSERGPNLCRFLRKEDRHKNEHAYPALHYPEIYLLEGGYKNFYENHKSMCMPVAYKPMNHPEHEQDFRKFRQKSKTWNMDVRQRPASRGGQHRRLL